MENKNGLHGKYHIQKIVTVPNPNFSATAKVSQVINNHDQHIKALKPVDENSEYFVLRLDIHQKDPKHREACLRALKTYADEIKPHLPELSADLYERYYLIQYNDRIAQLEAEREWVSVDDKLPESEGMYLCFCQGNRIMPQEFYHNVSGLTFSRHWDITHWQPLPQPPTEGDKG